VSASGPSDERREFVARHAMGPGVSGIALVAKDGFSARYDLDRINGVFSRPSHKLVGQSYRDRILILDAAKGGVATAWMLHEMKARGIAPLALVFNATNPIMAQGVALAGLTMLAGFDRDITSAIESGARVELIPEESLLRITK
jgi:predicted aconitase with swiveling domain